MTTLKIILAVIFCGAIAALIRWKLRSKAGAVDNTSELPTPQSAARPEAQQLPTGSPDDGDGSQGYVPEPPGHDTSEDLSDSGAFSIRAEIDWCVAAGLWPGRSR